MLVDCAHFRDGRRTEERSIDLERASEIVHAAEGDGFVWIGLVAATSDELAELQQRFGLNELAIEDAQSLHERPKVDLYPESKLLFVVMRSARYDDAREQVALTEVSIFLAPRVIITVRQAGTSELTAARRQVEQRPDLLRHGPSAVLWALLDTMVDDYSPVVAGLEQDVDEIEATIFGGEVAATERIYRLRGEVTDFARAVHPLLAPIDSLRRSMYPQIAKELVPFFRDVADHLRLVDEELSNQRDALGAVLQANLAVISLRQTEVGTRQNDVMKVLTVISTIFLPLTFITGFFGMNFGWMIDQIKPFWVFAVFGIGGVLVSAIALWAWFRHTGFLQRESPG